MAQDTEASSRVLRIAAGLAGALIVIAVWAALQLWGLERTPFHTKGEPREAVLVLDIVHYGNWILPRRNGVELPRKPPLFHWLAATSALGFGRFDEWAVRLPSAVLSGASALLLFGTGAALFGTRAALIAALALLTSFEWLRAATSARVDMTLAFGLTLAFAGLMMFRAGGRPAWLVAFYAGSAWATAAKGPVGIALPLLQVVLLCLIDRSFRQLRDVRLVRGFAIVLLVAGVWYVLATARGGRDFLFTQVLDENVFRFIGHERLTGGHRHSVAYLGSMLLAGFLPWTFFMPGAAASLWRTRHTLGRRDPRLFCIVWVLMVFGFYAFPASKRGVYLLPLYPALCLLLGWWADRLIRHEIYSRWLHRTAPPVAWLAAVICAAAGLAIASEGIGFPIFTMVGGFASSRTGDLVTVAEIIAAHSAALSVLFAGTAFAAVIAAMASQRQRWSVFLGGALSAIGAITLTTRLIILPGIAEAKTRRTFVAAVQDLVTEPGDLFTYRHFDYGTVFYWGRRIPVYSQRLSAHGPPYLLMSANDWLLTSWTERHSYAPVPNLQSGRGGNMGNMILLQRVPAAEAKRTISGGEQKP